MDDFDKGVYIGILIASIFWLMMIFLAIVPEQQKVGQIDALTGNIKYELVVNPDSTRTWEEID